MRAFNAVGGTPFFVERAEGAYLVDTEGNRYLDFVQSWGASILGHAASRRSSKRCSAAAAAGTSYGAPTAREVELAEAIADRVPSVDKVRLVSSGTEATMTAVRLARGCDRSHQAAEVRRLLPRPPRLAARRRGQRRGHARAPGLGRRHARARSADTIVVPFNDVEALDAAFAAARRRARGRAGRAGRREHGSRPAGASASSSTSRSAAREHGALFVCDEVITGFRLGPAGAQGRFDLTPDLSIFGKVIGGGLPLAAVGGRGRRDGPPRPARRRVPGRHALGEPARDRGRARRARPARAGATTTSSRRASPASPPRCATRSRGAGLAVQVPREGTLSGLFFSPSPVRDYDDAQAGDHETLRALLPRDARPRACSSRRAATR